MTHQDTVIRIVESSLGIDGEHRVSKDSDLTELGLDSLDKVQILIQLEDVFNCSFNEMLVAGWQKVSDIVTTMIDREM